MSKYTEEQTNEMVEAYNAAETDEDRKLVVEEFASEFAQSVASIRQKLVREGVYIKLSPKTKSGKPAERKAAIVADIASALGIAEETVDSLSAATKEALQQVRAGLTAQNLLIEKLESETETADS